MSRRRKEEKIFVNNYIPLALSDFYTKSRSQDVLSRPTEYFDLIYNDLHQKKLGHPLEYYQTITKDRFKDFDWQMTDYLTTFARGAGRGNLFFGKGFDHELFEKKIRIFSCLRWRKKFTIRNWKFRPLTIQNLIFNF